MANTSLYTAYTDSNWAGVTVAVGGGQEVGTAFNVTADGFINRLRWYRRTTNAADVPIALSLWDTATRRRLAGTSTVPDPGTVGWHDYVLPVSYPVISGQVLAVSGSYPLNQERSQDLNMAHEPSPGAHLAFQTSPLVYVNGVVGQYPESSAASLSAQDVAFDTTAENPGTIPPGGSELSDWLSIASNTHGADSAPIANHSLLATINTLTAAQLNFTGGLQGLSNELAAWIQHTSDWLAGGASSPYPSAVKKSDGTTAMDLLDILIADGAAIIAQLNAMSLQTGKLLGFPVFPDTGWSMSDETDFTTSLAWDVQADLYVVTITTPPPTMAADSFAGVPWYHRLGSWALLNGSQIASARGFVEFGTQEIQTGRRMPGLALQCGQATLGHVQAWELA